MLKTVNGYRQLLKSIDNWLQKNYLLSEEDYQHYLDQTKTTHPPTKKFFTETSLPNQKKIEEDNQTNSTKPDQDNMPLMQIIKDTTIPNVQIREPLIIDKASLDVINNIINEDLVENEILSREMINKILEEDNADAEIVGHLNPNTRPRSIRTGVFEDYSNNQNPLNRKFLFTQHGDYNIIQWDINARRLIANYVEIKNDGPISSYVITNDNLYLFIGYHTGKLNQFDIKAQKLVKGYECHSDCKPTKICVSSNSKFLF